MTSYTAQSAVRGLVMWGQPPPNLGEKQDAQRREPFQQRSLLLTSERFVHFVFTVRTNAWTVEAAPWEAGQVLCHPV